MITKVLIICLIFSLGISCWIEWELAHQLQTLQTTAKQFQQISISSTQSNIRLMIINGTNWFYGMDGNTVLYQSTNATQTILFMEKHMEK